jgi:hypothetical protein
LTAEADKLGHERHLASYRTLPFEISRLIFCTAHQACHIRWLEIAAPEASQITTGRGTFLLSAMPDRYIVGLVFHCLYDMIVAAASG